MSRLQRGLLALYRGAMDRGLLAGPLGRLVFESGYEAYKNLFEARAAAGLRQLVRPGTTVVDVGANIGYFTRRFAAWVGPAGCVVAIEPEAANLARLRARLAARRGRVARVEVVAAVAAEAPGRLRLAVNPYHPGDHRIGAEGPEVVAVTVDAVLAARPYPPVSLVKIDVQGAEERVLAGMAATLARDRPALYVEIDDAALRAMGSDARALLRRLDAAGYALHGLTRAGAGPAMDAGSDLDRRLKCAYLDGLFLPRA